MKPYPDPFACQIGISLARELVEGVDLIVDELDNALDARRKDILHFLTAKVFRDNATEAGFEHTK